MNGPIPALVRAQTALDAILRLSATFQQLVGKLKVNHDARADLIEQISLAANNLAMEQARSAPVLGLIHENPSLFKRSATDSIDHVWDMRRRWHEALAKLNNQFEIYAELIDSGRDSNATGRRKQQELIDRADAAESQASVAQDWLALAVEALRYARKSSAQRSQLVLPSEEIKGPLGGCKFQTRATEEMVEIVRATGLFDASYYRSQLEDILDPRIDPLVHYLEQGWKLGMNPMPLFSTEHYLRQEPESDGTLFEPLTHYIEAGPNAIRDPHPLFINNYYRQNLRRTALGKTSLLEDFLHREDAPSPHPLFDVSYYSQKAGLSGATAPLALLHYLVVGWRHDIAFSPLFNTSFYKSQWPKGFVKGEPYCHYIKYGVLNKLDPHPLFNAAFYLQLRPDALLKAEDPAVDFLLEGESLGISPSPFFDVGFYADRYRQRGELRGSFISFLTDGGKIDHWPRADFPSDRYRQAFMQGLAPAVGHSAIEHFLTQGIPELYTDDLPQLSALPSKIIADVVDSKYQEPSDQPVPLVNASRGELRHYKHYPGKRSYVKGAPNILLVGHAAGEKLFGSERSFLDMVDGLVSLPANVYVVLPRNVPDYTNAIRPMVQFVSTFEYDWWRKDKPASSDTQSLFEDLILSLKIEVVHCNTIMLRECIAAAKKCKIQSVIHVRELITQDQALVDLIGESAESIVRTVTQSADWIIGNSRITAEVFDKPGKTFFIPNTLAIDDFDIANIVQTERVRFGLISSNIPKKGVADVVEIAKICAAKCPEAEFHLIGPITPVVEALIEEQKKGLIPNNVVFPGYASSPLEAISQVHIALNFSHFSESFGRTVLEAMAAGRPVIAYQRGALPELIQHGRTGFLVPHMDATAAVPYVEFFCKNPDQISEFGENARQIVREKYGLIPYRRQIKDAYAKVMSQMVGNMNTPTIMPARLLDIKNVESNPRIAYFCWHFPVPSETFVLNELEALVGRGYDVMVFCRQSPHKGFKPSFDIEYERVDSVEMLAKRLRETGRTCVHAHFVYPTVTEMVWPACELADIPFTFIAHAQDIFKHENDQKNRLAEIGASKLCRKMFTLSQFHMDYVVGRGFPSNKVVINPNAIRTERFHAARSIDREDRRTRRIIAIHRYVPKKGLDLLISAFALVTDLNLTLDLFGYGECESMYQTLVGSLGLSNVKIHGQISQTEVIHQMLNADLFACPSVRTENGDMDGIPTSIVESMAAGLPVLATNIAGIPELVIDGLTGLICEPTPESIALAIRRYYAMSPVQVRAMIDSAAERSARNHDSERSARVLTRVWENRVTDIVIVAWNNLNELRGVVERVLKNTALPFHLIICDNQSEKDPVPEFLNELWATDDRVTIIHNNKNSMVGPGTNTALGEGNGDVAIYVCAKEGFSFGNGWEIPFIHAFDANPKAGLVGTIGRSPTYLTGEQYPKGISLFNKFRNKNFASDNKDRIFGHIQGGLFGMRRSMVDEIGGFSYDVPHDYTDVEYSYYVESCGWQLMECEQIMALFNKSRPTLSQRFDENIIVAHPCMLEELEVFDKVRTGQLRHCNICNWFGANLVDDIECPSCGSHPSDRTLYRWLSESPFMYRRLPALSVNLKGQIEKTWGEQFQGPRMTKFQLIDDLKRDGRLKNTGNGFHLTVVRLSDNDERDFSLICKEVARLLRAGGVALFQGEVANHDWRNMRVALADIMLLNGCVALNDVRYTSRALNYAYDPMLVFQKV